MICTTRSLRLATLTSVAVALVSGAGCSYPHLYEKGKIDEDYFERVERQTAKARGLDFVNPVPHEVITAEQAKQKIAADEERERDEKDETSLLRSWQALGYIPPGEAHSLGKDVVDLTAEQAAAFYDPREKRFYVSGVTDQARGVTTGLASWALDRDLVSEIVFSHELVHALQDQKYDLAKYDEGANKNDDAELARRAIVEGDATYYGFAALGLPNLAEGVELKREDMQDAGGDAWQRVPVILREELTFAYWAGNAFQRAIHLPRPGAAPHRDPWTDPPASTSEILHPEKFEAHWKPVEVQLGEIAASTSTSTSAPTIEVLVRENTVGEFGLRVLLEGQEKSKPEAEKASRGWAGDRYRVYETRVFRPSPTPPGLPPVPALALAWRLEFETPGDADAFVHAYQRFAKKKPIGHESSLCALAGERGAIVLEAPDGATLQALLPVVLGK